MFDLLLKNGLIADGGGGEPKKGDLAIESGRIAASAASIDPGLSRETLDVSGLCVAPGFVDMHSHSDVNFMKDDRCEAKLLQGVTTELMGQCGSSVYPCPEEHRERIEKFAGTGASCSLAEFAEKAEKLRMSTNLLPLVGHGALRCGVMEYADRAPTDAELSEMRALLRRDMETGAWGMSLGLGYAPGVSSSLPELCALAEEAAAKDGIVTSHMRYQNTRTPEALNEMFEINRRSGARVHIAHFKASGKAAWGRAPEFWRLICEAKASGVAVTADAYPYTAASSGITNSFPKWSIKGGKARALEALAGPERPRLMAELERAFPDNEAGARLLVVTTRGGLPEADGKTIAELSALWGVSCAEAAARVCEGSGARASCISFAMSEDDVMFLLGQNEISIGSDGRAHPFDPALNEGKPHPRNFGTFPRFLRLARDKKLCPLGMAVRRCTGLSADRIGLADRGYLRPGYVADVTVFDPVRVTDRAGYADPFRKPEGIIHVIMGGRFAVRDGAQTDARCGAVILKK